MSEPTQIQILKAVEAYKDFRTAIFFSYGVNLPFFEEGLIRSLWQDNCRTNLVYVDAARYADTITDWRDQVAWVGQRYLLVPVELGHLQSFHSKMILLLGPERGRLLLGSGNLTFSGLGVNQEIFTCLDWTPQAPEHQAIFQQAWQLVHQVQANWGPIDLANKLLNKTLDRNGGIVDPRRVHDGAGLLRLLRCPGRCGPF